jgi:hypothetical protein
MSVPSGASELFSRHGAHQLDHRTCVAAEARAAQEELRRRRAGEN